MELLTNESCIAFCIFSEGERDLWNRELVFEHFFQELKIFFYSVVFSYRASCNEEYYHEDRVQL